MHEASLRIDAMMLREARTERRQILSAEFRKSTSAATENGGAATYEPDDDGAYEMRCDTYMNLYCADPREMFERIADERTRVHDDTGDERHGDWEFGVVGRW